MKSVLLRYRQAFSFFVLAEVVAVMAAPSISPEQTPDTMILDPVLFAEVEGYEGIPEIRSNKRLAYHDETPLEMMDFNEEGKIRLKRLGTS